MTYAWLVMLVDSQISILCWSQIFEKYLPVYLFKFNIFGDLYRDQRRFLTILWLVIKQVVVPTTSCFACKPWRLKGCLFLDVSSWPLCIWSSPGFIWNLFKCFFLSLSPCFLYKSIHLALWSDLRSYYFTETEEPLAFSLWNRSFFSSLAI